MQVRGIRYLLRGEEEPMVKPLWEPRIKVSDLLDVAVAFVDYAVTYAIKNVFSEAKAEEGPCKKDSVEICEGKDFERICRCRPKQYALDCFTEGGERVCRPVPLVRR